jgi:hypothetical protein
MGPPQLSNVVRWQIIGMREAGMSLRQIAQSIDDAFGTIANEKLCVLVLVNISLQVFWNDSQLISVDFGLFL